MAERRRVSTRVKQEAPALKRARLEWNDTPKKAESKPEKAEKSVETTPSKAKNNKSKKSLPTVEHSRYSEIPSTELKSIAESGVLAASLRQSRSKWLSDGILQRYYVKPAKKKDQHEIKNNPPKETMQKLGPCTLKVEPHAFEATMYLVRDVPSAQPTTKPVHRPFLQYGPPGSGAFGYPNTPPHTVGYSRYAGPVGNPAPPPFYHRPQSGASSVVDSPQNHPHVNNGLSQPPAFPKPSQDPVIQMLATRASTNPELKALMKIVASGEASGDQLRVFQSHIDDLNAILQKQIQLSGTANGNATTTISAATNQNQLPRPSALPSPSSSQLQFQPTLPIPSPRVPTPQSIPRPMPPAVTTIPSKPQPPPNPHANSVVLELAGGSGDRYLLPKYSILELIPPNTSFNIGGPSTERRHEFILSFLLVRKGSLADGPSYTPKRDYYQPITLNIITTHPRVVDALIRAFPPSEEVRAHMIDVMARAERAENVHLCMQLPQDADDIVDIGKGAVEGRVTKARKERLDAAAEPRCRSCYMPFPGGSRNAIALAACVDDQGDDSSLCHACSGLVKNNLSMGYYRSGGIMQDAMDHGTSTQSLTLSTMVI